MSKTRYRALSEEELEIALVVGKKVQELRELNELSQSALGKQAGLNQTTLSLIETGKQLPSLGSLIKLSKVFDKELTIAFMEKGYLTQYREEKEHDNEKQKENSG